MTNDNDTPMVDAETETFDIRCVDAIELVTAYLDDALDERDLAVFTHHVAGCDGCAVFVDQIKMTIRLTGVAGSESFEVMPARFDELLAQLRGQAGATGDVDDAGTRDR